MAKKKEVKAKKAKKEYTAEEMASFAVFEAECKEHWDKKKDKTIKFVDFEMEDKLGNTKIYRKASNKYERWAIRKLTGNKSLNQNTQDALLMMGYKLAPLTRSN